MSGQIPQKPNSRLRPFYLNLGDGFSGFEARGTLLLVSPIDRVVGGFAFAPAQNDSKRRWLSVFVQPLFIPQGFLAGFGKRISKRQALQESASSVCVNVSDRIGVEETIDVMHTAKCEWFPQRTSLHGFYDFLVAGDEEVQLFSDRSTWCEALAYTATLLGKRDAALAHIDDALMEYILRYHDLDAPHSSLGSIRDWQVEQIRRLRFIRELIEKSKMLTARSTLDQWQKATVNKLTIEDLVTTRSSP